MGCLRHRGGSTRGRLRCAAGRFRSTAGRSRPARDGAADWSRFTADHGFDDRCPDHVARNRAAGDRRSDTDCRAAARHRSSTVSCLDQRQGSSKRHGEKCKGSKHCVSLSEVEQAGALRRAFPEKTSTCGMVPSNGHVRCRRFVASSSQSFSDRDCMNYARQSAGPQLPTERISRVPARRSSRCIQPAKFHRGLCGS